MANSTSNSTGIPTSLNRDLNKRKFVHSNGNSNHIQVKNELHHSTSTPSLANEYSAFACTKPTSQNQSLLTTNNNKFFPTQTQPPFGASQLLSTHIPSAIPSSNSSTTSSSTSNNPVLSSSSSNGSSVSSGSGPAPPIQSLFAAHQHHQFLLAAAQAAAANGQNANYLHRLFTPYHLLDQQNHSHPHHSSVPQSSALLKPSLTNPTSHLSTPQPQSFNMFHSPHKRRRTKVTDTRLSPRNPSATFRGLGAGQLNLNGKNRSRDESPVNDNDDDQENLDYDDEQQQINQEDDSASSGCNESGSTAGSGVAGGQLATMPNGYGSGNNSNNVYMNDAENTPSEYIGYQISFLKNLKNQILNYFI